MSERTGVQRRTLVGALLLASVAGAGVLALVDDTDGGNSRRISDTVSSTTAEPVTTELVTTPAPAAPAEPVPVPTTAKAPIEQRVDDHEQRIDTLEATTTVAPATTSKPTPPPTTMTSTTNCYQPDLSGDCDPSNNG